MAVIPTLTMNPTIDKSTRIDRVVPERKLRCQPPHYEPGGGGINVARAIHKLGGNALAYYAAGQATGRMLQNLLAEEALEHRPLSIEGRTRVSFTVYEDASGQQYRFSVPGPTLSESEWQTCLDEFFEHQPGPEWIVVSGSIPRGVPTDFYARIARRAKQTGAKMILDATGDPFLLAVREGVFLIKPNLREFRALAENDMADEAQHIELAQQIINSGQSEVVVVSLGASGALLVDGNESQRITAPLVRIQSKVGAGDSMVAGIALGLSRGFEIAEAVRFGVAAGASAVKTPGTELCRREDTEQLFNQMQ